MSIKYVYKFKPPPRPRPCLIAALDIIGIDDPAMPEGRARQAVARLIEYLGDDSDLASHYGSHWSLAANRALYIAPTKRDGMLPFRVILKVLHLQMALIPLGVVVRGAISLGEATTHDDVIIGKGVANADRLREEVADVPRVIVDPALLQAIESNADLWALHHNSMDELGYVHNLLREDTDGIWFIDYLRASNTEVNDQEDYHKFLHDHKVLVERKLAMATSLNRSTRAITWLWHYHDQRVNLLKQRFATDLLIAPNSPLLYRFPSSAIAPD